MKTLTNCAEKKANQLFNLLQGYTKGVRMTAILVLLLMGVSNAWAVDYYYRGNQNSWGTTKMTVSNDGYYSYYKAKSYENNGNKNNEFKISKSISSYDYGSSCLSSGFNGTNVTNMGDWDNSGDNCGIYHTSDYYVLVYHPNTTINTSSEPKICAATYLPDNRECTVYFVNKDSWNTVNAYGWYYQNSTDGSNNGWPGKAMTNTGKTYNGKQIWSYTYPQTYDKAIFNNGSNQTSNLTLGTTNKGKMYDYPNSQWIAYTYDVKVTFNANGHGTAPTAKTVLKGGKVTAPTAPTATGYTFGGWYKEANCTNAFDFNTAITANITLYAKWTPIRCNITLTRGDGASGGSEYVYATYGSNILEPEIENPTKTGYNFLGWSNQGGNVIVIGTNGKLLPSKSNGSLITYTDANGNWAHTGTSSGLWAQWEAAKYNINYKDQGNANFSGTHASGYPTQHTYGKATSLLTATKTGYTFEGWFKNPECTGSAVTTLGSRAYTATITLYAKWTINQYTLDFGAGEGGSVTATVDDKEISSPATLSYGTSVKLTATPSGENAFAQWVDEDDVKLSTANPYTLTIRSDKIVKAEFSKPTTVYLKTSEDWRSNNAHFAIYAWGGKSGDPWVDMEAVDCEGEYYKANVPAGFSDFAFVRLKEGGEHDWANKLNQTGNLTVQTNGKNMYDVEDKTMTYIHLEAKAWDNGDARFAAYFFGNGDKWVNLTKNGDVYSCKKPEGYTSVIFCRMIKNNADNNFNNCWNKTKDLSLMDNGDNCFWIDTDNSWGCAGDVPGDEANDGDGDRDGADGGWYRLLDDSQWKTFTTPTYDVTIKPTIHGTYSVVCNGRAYPVTYKEEIVIPNVPVGTILTIQDVKPNKETEYTSDIIYKESANAAYQKLDGNQITVCGNTTIDENFVTKNTHVVYLRIPNGLAWGTGNYQKLSVYNKLTESYTPTAMTEANGTYEPGYKYYTCTIPAETHTIRFEYINGNTKYQTHDFPHVMPLGSLNCYTIHSKEGESTVFNGYWSELLSNGDYRLLYVEQTVEKDANNKTIINRRKAHPSDIIPASIISAGSSKVVSLHIFKDRTYTDAVKKYDGGTPTYYESNNNPEVILQQYNGTTWENKERHMVFGPLKTLPGMAMAPGRRNAAADAELVYDDGIENIKNDNHVDQGSGVWNFTVKRLEGNQATIDLTSVKRYTGDYYIRTDVANGGWFNYNPTNHMTRSDEAKANSNFSHYYCKWVESDNNVNVKFTVANDYGYAISDTLEADRTDLWGVALAAEDKMVTDQKLPKNANVRFAWNEYSNFIHRAYIAGSAVVGDRFLVLEGDANIFDENGSQLKVSGLDANQQIFRDNSNWIYYADVQMKPMAPVKVTAKYNDKTQYFIGKQNETVTLLQGSGSEKYLIRMLYDFKTNQLISAYVPGASPDVHAISTNLMLIRQNNNEATQLIFNNETPRDMEPIPTDRRAYGVIEFTEKRLINGKDNEDKSLNEYEKSLYWISFPFNVDVSKAISFGEYGKHWIIQEYNGKRRAAEGMWLDSETFWDYKWDQNITLEAGKGYVLALDVDQIASDGLFGLAGNRPIGIYFPSTEYINTAITEQRYVSTTVPAWECTIKRETPKGDRRIADSHWNVIGVPSYVNAKGDYSFADIKIETKPTEVKYYYRWDGNFNAYTAMETTGTQNFQSTYAYMVQFAGQINWQNIFNVSGAPQALAAKKSTYTEQEHRLRLELHQNGNKADHTFVRLQDEDGVTDRFDFNHDLCKVINAGANIYSVITTEESPVEVAANVLPINETIIPVGVKITAAGEYTFAMPDGTDGIVVELIDYETNTTTNLLLDNYTVNLGKGTFDNRFALHVQPSKVTTSVEDINTNSNGVKKYLIDGILYMQKDGVLYDAQGKLVR